MNQTISQTNQMISDSGGTISPTDSANQNINNNSLIDIPQLTEESIRSAVVNSSLNNGILVTLANSTNLNSNLLSNQNTLSNTINLIPINTPLNHNVKNNNTSNLNSNNQSSNTSTNHSEKRKQHNCPFCDRSFTRPYRLNDHISFSHTDERKYMCSLCSKNFSCKDKLKHHIDVKHDNKKPNIKTKTKLKNVEDLKCSYPGCTKTFANKYNVKRHVENVHLKMKRKHNKSSSSSNNNSNTNNNSSFNLNNSNSQPTTSTSNTTSSSSSTVNPQNNPSSSVSTIKTNSNSISSISNSVANSIISLPINSSPVRSTQFVTKIEPNSTSTPILTTTNKHISKLASIKSNNNNNTTNNNTNSNTSNNSNLTTNLSLNNLNSNSNAILTNGTPLTLVATSNGIGGITLTTLGSIHQQHQQQQHQQNSSATAVVAALGLTPLTNGLSGNTTLLTLNGSPLLIQQPTQTSQTNLSNQQHVIYQQPTLLQQVITTAATNPSSSSKASSINQNGILITNSNICLNSISNSNLGDLNNTINGNNLLNTAQNSNCTLLSNPMACNNSSSNSNHNNNNNINSNSNNYNAVAVAAAAELVNSLLVKSEHQQIVQDNDGLISFSDLNNHAENDQSNEFNSLGLQQTQTNTQENQVGHSNDQNDVQEDEKDAKIYTCARCPEIFNSSNLLRKHVSENHEKEYECCICNLNFNNRFAFLKHKYFHINIESSKTRLDSCRVNDLSNISKSKDEKNCDKLDWTKLNSDFNSNNLLNGSNIENSDNVFDLNSLYKRSLSNIETLLNMNVPYSSSSQLILKVIKSKNISNDDSNLKLHGSSNLVNIMRQNSYCELCKKCFSEKKKFLAHKKLCENKNNKANDLSIKGRIWTRKEKIENDLVENIKIKNGKTSSHSKNKTDIAKKQKLNNYSSIDSGLEIELKDLNDSNSMNLNFLFE